MRLSTCSVCRRSSGQRTSQRRCSAIRRLGPGSVGKRLLLGCLACGPSLSAAIGVVPIRELQKSKDRQYREARRGSRAIQFARLMFVASGAICSSWTNSFSGTPSRRLNPKRKSGATSSRSWQAEHSAGRLRKKASGIVTDVKRAAARNLRAAFRQIESID